MAGRCRYFGRTFPQRGKLRYGTVSQSRPHQVNFVVFVALLAEESRDAKITTAFFALV